MWFDNDPEIRTFEMPEESLEKMKQFVLKRKLKNYILMMKLRMNYMVKMVRWFRRKAKKFRNHQRKSFNNWEDNNRRDLLEMHRDQGKTFIALCAIRELFWSEWSSIILVPTKLLFNQWKKWNHRIIYWSGYHIRTRSRNPLDTSRLLIYSNSNPNINMKRCILATYSIASKENFINNVQWGNIYFYVCDEVHNIGSQKS